MQKNVLVIDDEPDKRALEDLSKDLEYAVNKGQSVSFNVNLQSVNPLKYIDFGKPENEQLQSFFNYLSENFLQKKLDMLLCDFNLHANHKHLAFHVVDYVRKHNKACAIVLFSGSPLKELIRLNNGDLATKLSDHILNENTSADVKMLSKKLEQLRKEEEPAEELMEMVVRSKIDAIVTRTKYEEKAIDLITKPSLLLWVENELSKNAGLIFNDGNEKLNGKKMEEISKHIREQSEEGINFTNEIIRISLSNLIALQS